MIPAIRAVLFDFGGTLDSDGYHWQDRFLSLYSRAGLEIPRQEFARAFYDADDHLAERFDLGTAGFEQTVRFQVESVVKNLGDRARPGMAEAVSAGFVADARSFFHRNKALLRALGRRYQLGVVSNNYGNMDAMLASEGLDGFFGAVADSACVGASKPDKKIFLHAVERLGINPEQALMVGDSLRRDMLGAEALGMPHAWLRGPQDPDAVCCGRAHVLETLMDLESLLLGSEVRA